VAPGAREAVAQVSETSSLVSAGVPLSSMAVTLVRVTLPVLVTT
jgi:hypothetical protein